MATKPCLKCGKSFVVNPTRHVHNYCSRSCVASDRYRKVRERKQIQVSCLHCQQSITCWNSNPRKYCSSQCNYRHRVTMGVPKQRSLRQSLVKYKISKQDWDQLMKLQDGRCAICRKPETELNKGTVKRLAIDHCHETNKVRGLLCGRCNQGIGRFEDSWLLLDNAMEYLTYWHSKHGSSKVEAIQESPLLN